MLSSVCDAVAAKPPQTASEDILSEYSAYVKILAWRIRNISGPSVTERGMASLEGGRVTQLFQLSMLVYLNRATGGSIEPEPEIQEHIARAFGIFTELSACERQFPLFILGCEARTEDERCIVLDLINRTETCASSRSLFLVRRLIQAIWVQDDLADGKLNYADTLSAMISCCAIMPTFV